MFSLSGPSPFAYSRRPFGMPVTCAFLSPQPSLLVRIWYLWISCGCRLCAPPSHIVRPGACIFALQLDVRCRHPAASCSSALLVGFSQQKPRPCRFQPEPLKDPIYSVSGGRGIIVHFRFCRLCNLDHMCAFLLVHWPMCP